MLNETNIEQRLSTLEKQVSELQSQLKSNSNSNNWLEQLIGSISDEEIFLQALEYGREFRKLDQPIDDDTQES
jgi:DNA-binding transcriptional regulator GbsR (MarR family)